MPTETKPLNIYQKILKIADMAGALQKTKQAGSAAYGYKYVPEEDIQAKITAGMQEYGVLLTMEIVPGTMRLTPITYEKYDKNAKQIIHKTELIFTAEAVYTWTDVNDPTQVVKVPWVLVGQMEDAAQAFGAAATYCNRYFLIKSLQLATSEADPDFYRGKQQEALEYAEEKAQESLADKRKEILEYGKTLIAKRGIKPAEIRKIVETHNDGEGNVSLISSIAVCEAILQALNALEAAIPAKSEETQTTKKTANAAKSK